MYNEQLEELIDAALADGELTEKEKQILFKRAQSMGVDLYEFEMVLDSKLQKMQKEAKPSAPKSDKFGDVRKCPACGAMLQTFETRCSECGYEFKNVDAVNSAQQLFNLLQKASSKNQIQEKQTIIKGFPVPNTKEDLFELLAMATSNAYDNDGVIGPEEEVWIQKCDQIYSKIKIVSGKDKQMLDQASEMIIALMLRLPKAYKQFTNLPEDVQKRYEEQAKNKISKARNNFIESLKIPGIMLVLGIIATVVGGLADLDWAIIIGIVLGVLGIKICKGEMKKANVSFSDLF